MSAAEPKHIHALQKRVLGAVPVLPGTARELFRELRRALQHAYDHDLLATPPHEFGRLLKQDRGADVHRVIVGGAKNFHRDPGLPHFKRNDGAWFDFAITVAERRGRPLELIGYNFELRFAGAPGFVRFDLNNPGHANEARGLRAHIHPGNDDLQVPSPLMSPIEVLDLVLHSLRPERKPRAA